MECEVVGSNPPLTLTLTLNLTGTVTLTVTLTLILIREVCRALARPKLIRMGICSIGAIVIAVSTCSLLALYLLSACSLPALPDSVCLGFTITISAMLPPS